MPELPVPPTAATVLPSPPRAFVPLWVLVALPLSPVLFEVAGPDMLVAVGFAVLVPVALPPAPPVPVDVPPFAPAAAPAPPMAPAPPVAAPLFAVMLAGPPVAEPLVALGGSSSIAAAIDAARLADVEPLPESPELASPPLPPLPPSPPAARPPSADDRASPPSPPMERFDELELPLCSWAATLAASEFPSALPPVLVAFSLPLPPFAVMVPFAEASPPAWPVVILALGSPLTLASVAWVSVKLTFAAWPTAVVSPPTAYALAVESFFWLASILFDWSPPDADESCFWARASICSAPLLFLADWFDSLLALELADGATVPVRVEISVVVLVAVCALAMQLGSPPNPQSSVGALQLRLMVTDWPSAVPGSAAPMTRAMTETAAAARCASLRLMNDI